jgi:radical SAM superfamily enzyme YgiQ (UPF0313 family)
MPQIILFTGSTLNHMVRSIGAYQIASRLRYHGYTVQVIDYFPTIFNSRNNLILNILNHYVSKDTLWVGFSSTFFDNNISTTDAKRSNYDEEVFFNSIRTKEIKELIYSINPKCKIVLGGSKAAFLKIPAFIDYYVEGYADNSVISLTQYLENKNPFFQFVLNSDGSRSISNDQTAALFDFSNYEFSWHESDSISISEALPIEISRGCIFKCAFCTYPLNGKKKLDYIKSPEILLNEFKRNYELFGTTNYIYSDDTHNDSVEKLEMLYDKVYSKLNFKISFGSYIRLDLLRAHPHTIDLLKESGLSSCFFGIESLNYDSNKVIGKGMKTENILSTLELLKDKWRDIFKEAGFIVGLPNDSIEGVRNWLDTITADDFPLDRISLSPLRIHQKSTSIWSNLIEQRPADYGYKFTSSIDWINNKGLSRKQASEIVNHYTQYSKSKIKLSWATVETMPNNLGISKKEFLKLSFADMQTLKNIKVDEYIKKIYPSYIPLNTYI